MALDDVIRALRAPDQSHSGRVAGGMGADATDRLAALDAHARTVRMWSPLLVPGVLQTPAYAAAAIRARTPSLPADEVERRTRHRERRSVAFRERFGRGGGAFASFIVGEAAIAQGITTVEEHADQLEHLAAVIERHPRIEVLVLPDDASTAGTIEPFSIHALDAGPRVGHLETVIGGWYTIRAEDITRLYSAISVLDKGARPAAETRRVITQCLQRCTTSSGAESRSSSRPTATPTRASTSPGRRPAPWR